MKKVKKVNPLNELKERIVGLEEGLIEAFQVINFHHGLFKAAAEDARAAAEAELKLRGMEGGEVNDDI